MGFGNEGHIENPRSYPLSQKVNYPVINVCRNRASFVLESNGFAGLVK
jgi:hypothetical protein